MRIPVDAAIVIGIVVAIPGIAALMLLGAALRKAARGLGFGRLPAPAFLERGWAWGGAAATLAAYGLALLYAWKVEPEWVELTRTEIAVPRRVFGLERCRIVQLTDLHLKGFGTRERRVAQLVREAKPDLIVLTGDYGRTAEASEALAELGRMLEAPYGKFAIRGNDDHGNWPPRATLAAAGIVLLHNEARVIDRGGEPLCLAGLDYASKVPLRAVLRGQQKGEFTIFLYHSPDGIDQVGELEPGEHVDLVLCGHTHGGQICVPFWGAVITETKYHKKYESGLYRVGGIPMYVNRGLGTTLLPLRFLARPEVAVIDLVCREGSEKRP